MLLRTRLAAVVLACLSLASACSSDDVPEQVDGFTAITDCKELERLASVEVDRISSTGDTDIAAAATARFQRIVAHRDSIC